MREESDREREGSGGRQGPERPKCGHQVEARASRGQRRQWLEEIDEGLRRGP